MKPRCTVILTSYNRPALLKSAIKSVFAQTETNWQLIVADDNSGPGVIDLLHKLLDDDPRCSWWTSDVSEEDRPKRVRYAVNINGAFPMARGDILLYLCDDNEFYPDCLKTVCDYFDEHPDIHAAYFRHRTCVVDWKTGKIIEMHGVRSVRGTIDKVACGVLDHSQVAHRREIFGDGWPEEPVYWGCADGQFFDRILAQGYAFHHIPVELALYKDSPQTSMCRQVDRSVAFKRLREEGDVLDARDVTSILFVVWDYPILLDRIVYGLSRMPNYSATTVHAGRLPEVMHRHFDFVIFYHPWHGDIPTSVARALGDVSILWSVESPYEIDIIERAGKEVDLLWDTDRNSTKYLEGVLGKRVIHSPACVYPSSVGFTSGKTISSDICFVGNAFPLRVKLIKEVADELKGYDVLLVGSGWKQVAPWARTAEYYHSPDYMAAIAGAKITLNVHRQNDIDHANRNKICPSSPNGRLFDQAMIGCTQLVDSSRIPELWEYFTDDEIAVFVDPNDFMAQIRGLLENTARRVLLKRNAQMRVKRSHLFVDRFAKAMRETRNTI